MTTQTPQPSASMLAAITARTQGLAAAMLVGLALLAPLTTQAQYNFITLDAPLAGQGTFAQGVSGNNVVGFYYAANGTSHGFLYDGTSYTTLNDPQGNTQGNDNTRAIGISGNNIVGNYANISGQYAFRYNGSSYTTLNPASVDNSFATGISGNNIVGYYWDNDTFFTHGFLYNGSTYTTLDDPLAVPGFFHGTYVTGISGNGVVGYYNSGPDNSPSMFLYDGTSFVTLPGPAGALGGIPTGISGNNIIGRYGDDTGDHWFLFDGSSYTTLVKPLEAGDDPAFEFTGISGNTVVGNYTDSSGNHHAFIATVPEPSTLSLAGLGAAASILHLKKRNRSRTVNTINP